MGQGGLQKEFTEEQNGGEVEGGERGRDLSGLRMCSECLCMCLFVCLFVCLCSPRFNVHFWLCLVSIEGVMVT